jgi:hypothetical protein
MSAALMVEVVRELRAGESLADFDHRERGVPTQWPVAERTCRTPQWRTQANLQKNPLLFTPFQNLGNPRITTRKRLLPEKKNTRILLGAPHCTHNHTLYLKGLSHDSVSLQYYCHRFHVHIIVHASSILWFFGTRSTMKNQDFNGV